MYGKLRSTVVATLKAIMLQALFGKKKTPAEMLRENKRSLDKAMRDLDRERAMLQNQEKKLIQDIKKTAKEGQMPAVKQMARDLVRTRAQVTKFYGLKSQLQAVSLRMQTLKSTQAMSDAMKGVTKAMGMMNKQMKLPMLLATMREFERQNERMENTSEMMGDAIDGAFEGENEDEETDEAIGQVLDELGLSTDAQLVSVPSGGAAAVPVSATPAERVAAVAEAEPSGGGSSAGGGVNNNNGGNDDAGAPGGGMDDLQARLDNLRKM